MSEHIKTSKFEAKILILLAENSMNISEVARTLCYHRNTICYHIEQIKKKTGKDPLILFDLAELLTSYLPQFDGLKLEGLRTGRWVRKNLNGEGAWECSVCKTLGSSMWKRCPMCEAKMVREGW